jgi:glycosyltransferase involved in cell wall biosynthesis
MPEQKPQFSIIIATGNRAHLAKMAVQSVLNQTCQDFEIILADWSGTAESHDIAKLDPRIQYMLARSDTPYGGWNLSVRKARGEYLLWLDDDNYLLPYALELFARKIEKTHADVLTSTHLYYYDAEHPRVHLRNSLGVIPFSGTERNVDLKQVLQDQFAFKRSSTLIRLHTSATVVSHRLVRQSLEKLGLIILDYLPNIHSMFPILMSFAKTCRYVDHPIVIVGRYGNSLSQDWAMRARKRFSKQPFPITMSPVKGYARINSTLENYLHVKRILPDFYRNIPIGYEQFARIYMQELAYLDSNLRTLVANWVNLFRFLKTFPAETKKPLLRKAFKFAALAPLVYLSRRLKLYPLWRNAVGYATAKTDRKKTAQEKMAAGKEFVIPLQEKYRVDSISSLAEHVQEIVLTETGRDISVVPQ